MVKGLEMKKFILILSIITINLLSSEIESTCSRQWGTDYRMVKYCIKEQTKSRNSIKESHTYADSEIEAYCRGAWNTDYRMVKYCIDDLTSTKDSLKANGLTFFRVENGRIVARATKDIEAEEKEKAKEQEKKEVRKQDKTRQEPNIIKITKAEEAELLKEKYKDTPTLYIKKKVIYGVLNISYFRGDKTKIMIEGKEKSFVIPSKILLKEARFENATDELNQKLNSLIKNSNLKDAL